MTLASAERVSVRCIGLVILVAALTVEEGTAFTPLGRGTSNRIVKPATAMHGVVRASLGSERACSSSSSLSPSRTRATHTRTASSLASSHGSLGLHGSAPPARMASIRSASKPNTEDVGMDAHASKDFASLNLNTLSDVAVNLAPLVTSTILTLAIVASVTNNPALAAGEEMLLAPATSGLTKLFGDGFIQAFSLIFVSEIGDKTFFIAALLSAKFTRLISLTGSIGALVVMTGISVLTGQIFHNVPASLTQGLPVDDYVACAAFAYFGYRTLKEAYETEEDEKGGELEDAEEALEKVSDAEGTPAFWGLVAQTFTLVFAAEFGDRSFLSTIALAAAQNPFSVASGAVVAHTIATLIAVAGGAILSKYISEKVIGYIGGSLFIVFSLTTLVGIF